MRKMITVMAVVALAACDSATASDRGARNDRPASAPAAAGPTLSEGAGHRTVIVSVRKRVAGTPALYEARGVAVDGGELTVEVRSSTIGFNTLTSGTLVAVDTWTGEVNLPFQADAGTRYMVVAYPSANGVYDQPHATYIEAVP